MGMREKLAEVIDDYFGVDSAYFGVDKYQLADHIIANGVTIPVRCKNCKFLHDKGYCTKITGLTRIKPDDFCSFGERKDNAV